MNFFLDLLDVELKIIVVDKYLEYLLIKLGKDLVEVNDLKVIEV